MALSWSSASSETPLSRGSSDSFSSRLLFSSSSSESSSESAHMLVTPSPTLLDEIIFNSMKDSSPLGNKYFNRNQKSNKVDDKAFKIKVNYTGSGVSLESIFVRNFTFGECINNGYNYVSSSAGKAGKIYGTTSWSTTVSNFNKDACKGPDSDEKTTADNCCPTGYICSKDDGCVPQSNNAPLRCEDYSTLTECNNDALGLWKSQQSAQTNSCTPRDPIARSCAWKDSVNGGSGGCTLNTTVQDINGVSVNSCLEYAKNTTACINGYYKAKVEATSLGTNTCFACQSGEFPVPCGRPAFELPFFGWKQAIGVIVILIVFYLFMRKKKVNNEVKKIRKKRV